MKNLDEITRLIVAVEAELAELESSRSDLIARAAELQREKATLLQPPIPPNFNGALMVTNYSSQDEKIAIFRSLFRGREDIYPRRFETMKTGKQGYQPVCKNEWIRGVCEKPNIRCEDCEHREFLPVTDLVIRNHLQGIDPQDRAGRNFTIGVYPMLSNETCWFLAADFHHISAVSFEQVIRQSKAKYLTGLSATVTRNDGHQPIIFMQCGPVHYRVNDRDQANKRPFGHKVVMRPTKFKLPLYLQNIAVQSIQDVPSLEKDDERNQLIVEDVVDAVEANRFPVLLTERREHLETLSKLLEKRVAYVFVMKGRMGKKQRQHLKDQIANLPADQSRVILATGRYTALGHKLRFF